MSLALFISADLEAWRSMNDADHRINLTMLLKSLFDMCVIYF